MFVGHFAAAFLAKRIAPGISLGTMMLAAGFPDLLFCVFLLAGIEHVAIQPGITAVNALYLYDIPLSHSLLLNVAVLTALWVVSLGGAPPPSPLGCRDCEFCALLGGLGVGLLG